MLIVTWTIVSLMDLLSTLVFFLLKEFINMYENLYKLLCNTLKLNFIISQSFVEVIKNNNIRNNC